MLYCAVILAVIAITMGEVTVDYKWPVWLRQCKDGLCRELFLEGLKGCLASR